MEEGKGERVCKVSGMCVLSESRRARMAWKQVFAEIGTLCERNTELFNCTFKRLRFDYLGN